MSIADTQDHLTSDGVAFSVAVDYKNYDCLVSNEALSSLIAMSDQLREPFDAYNAYKSKIHGVARRLVTAGVVGTPVILQLSHFRPR